MEFSHTYIMRELLDTDEQHSILNLSSNDYTMRPATGFIDYDAFDGSHTWRVYTERNKFGNYMVEIRHMDSQIFETGFSVL
jgi:hypothetical protein